MNTEHHEALLGDIKRVRLQTLAAIDRAVDAQELSAQLHLRIAALMEQRAHFLQRREERGRANQAVMRAALAAHRAERQHAVADETLSMARQLAAVDDPAELSPAASSQITSGE